MNNKVDIKLSILLLTYNHEEYIRQAMDSILSQETNFKFEILIGDDCSSDSTPHILREYKNKYPDKIKLFLRNENLGATRNSYLLMEKCEGEFIAPLEGDDYWLEKNRLQILVDFLENNPSYMCVSHLRERRDLDNNLLGYDPAKKLIEKDFTIKNFLNGDRFSVMGSVFRNFISSSNGKYADYIQCTKNVGDYQTAMCILELGPVYILNKVLGVYRVRRGGNHSNYNSITSLLEKYYDHMKILNSTADFFGNKYNLLSEVNDIHSKTILSCIRFKNFKDLFEILGNIESKNKIFLNCGRILFKKIMKI